MAFVEQHVAFTTGVQIQFARVFATAVQLVGIPGVQFGAPEILAVIGVAGAAKQFIDFGAQRTFLHVSDVAGAILGRDARLGLAIDRLGPGLGLGLGTFTGELGREVRPVERIREGLEADLGAVVVEFGRGVVTARIGAIPALDQRPDPNRDLLRVNILQRRGPIGNRGQPVLAITQGGKDVRLELLRFRLGGIAAQRLIDLGQRLGHLGISIERLGLGERGVCRYRALVAGRISRCRLGALHRAGGQGHGQHQWGQGQNATVHRALRRGGRPKSAHVRRAEETLGIPSRQQREQQRDQQRGRQDKAGPQVGTAGADPA